jgi:hypothetical protein
MNSRISVVTLVVCAVSDLAAVPLLDAGIAVGIAALGLITLGTAVGVGRGARWGRPLALGTRAVDAVAAIPAVAAADGAQAAAGAVTVALSLLTIALLLRRDEGSVRTA